MNFIGYTYKADVEHEKSMLVNVLKDLDTISESQTQQKNGIPNNKCQASNISSNGGNSFRDMSRSHSEQ